MNTAQDIVAADSSPGSIMLGILIFGGLIAGFIAYDKWKRSGFRAREVTTTLSVDDLTAAFEQKVCGMGWKVVDRGDPLIAQSSLAAGIRQQIALHVEDQGSQRLARIWVPRYSQKVFGGTTKAHTLRMRMSSFLNEVQRRDAAATVAG
jgi:hypothetical protein